MVANWSRPSGTIRPRFGYLRAGDRLLMAVAARLMGTLRDVDTIGRMGGDEFVVLIDGAHLAVAPEQWPSGCSTCCGNPSTSTTRRTR